MYFKVQGWNGWSHVLKNADKYKRPLCVRSGQIYYVPLGRKNPAAWEHYGNLFLCAFGPQ